METRLLVAYFLIGAIVVGGSALYARARARRRARALRMRGVKVEQKQARDRDVSLTR